MELRKTAECDDAVLGQPRLIHMCHEGKEVTTAGIT